MEKYESLTSGISSKGILVFCREPYDRQKNDLNVRMFAPYYGVTEDPATGSANGCLAAYLVKHRYFGKPEVDVRVEQGYEIGRPSLLYLRSSESKGSIDVRVGGRVIPIAKGELV
jgi:trans-2,3-dihydro-3-hydroxyanthranilate isomerase